MKANQMLRHVMKIQGREIQWFSEILGVSPSQMSLIVNGKKEIDPIPASRIAGALGVPLLFVFEEPDGSIEGPPGSSLLEVAS